MACTSSEEESMHLCTVDRSRNLPADSSYLQLSNQKLELDGMNQHFLLDVLPVVIEKGSAPVEETNTAQNSHEDQGTHDISTLSVEGNASPNCTSQLAFLSFLEFPIPEKSQMSLDPLPNKQSYIDLQMESADAYSSCIVDIDIGIAKPEDGAFGSMKCGGLVTGVLQRQASLKACGKFMEIVTNHGSPLLNLISREKSFNERVHDTPNNRWRKCKRAASLDSRKVVLLFSIMSSLGTLILIYLTLRVRHAADTLVSV